MNTQRITEKLDQIFIGIQEVKNSLKGLIDKIIGIFRTNQNQGPVQPQTNLTHRKLGYNQKVAEAKAAADAEVTEKVGTIGKVAQLQNTDGAPDQIGEGAYNIAESNEKIEECLSQIRDPLERLEVRKEIRKKERDQLFSTSMDIRVEDNKYAPSQQMYKQLRSKIEELDKEIKALEEAILIEKKEREPKPEPKPELKPATQIIQASSAQKKKHTKNSLLDKIETLHNELVIKKTDKYLKSKQNKFEESRKLAKEIGAIEKEISVIKKYGTSNFDMKAELEIEELIFQRNLEDKVFEKKLEINEYNRSKIDNEIDMKKEIKKIEALEDRLIEKATGTKKKEIMDEVNVRRATRIIKMNNYLENKTTK